MFAFPVNILTYQTAIYGCIYCV